jgi:hypothetical protein
MPGSCQNRASSLPGHIHGTSSFRATATKKGLPTYLGWVPQARGLKYCRNQDLEKNLTEAYPRLEILKLLSFKFQSLKVRSLVTGNSHICRVWHLVSTHLCPCCNLVETLGLLGIQALLTVVINTEHINIPDIGAFMYSLW